MALASINFFSESLGVSTSMQVILPQSTSAAQIGMQGASLPNKLAVLYLLHGWSDDDTIWCRRTSIERYVADLPLLVVMPRVELSYYQNMHSGMRFWDFIADELPSLVQQWFPVSCERSHTFAAGLSMGGYGAFRLGLQRPSQFAAVASLSGALDLNAKSKSPEDDPIRFLKTQAIFGPNLEGINADADLLHHATTINPADCPQLLQICGTEDFLYPHNQSFKAAAEANALPLTYREAPGDHNWAFWDLHIQEVLRWLPLPSVS